MLALKNPCTLERVLHLSTLALDDRNDGPRRHDFRQLEAGLPKQLPELLFNTFSPFYEQRHQDIHEFGRM